MDLEFLLFWSFFAVAVISVYNVITLINQNKRKWNIINTYIVWLELFFQPQQQTILLRRLTACEKNRKNTFPYIVDKSVYQEIPTLKAVLQYNC